LKEERFKTPLGDEQILRPSHGTTLTRLGEGGPLPIGAEQHELVKGKKGKKGLRTMDK